MIPLLVTAAIVIGLPLLYVLVQFNQLVGLRNYIRESWSNIDTELKRRYDLIPNLVAAVKGYATHERDVLERVTELRNRCAANNGPVPAPGSNRANAEPGAHQVMAKAAPSSSAAAPARISLHSRVLLVLPASSISLYRQRRVEINQVNADVREPRNCAALLLPRSPPGALAALVIADAARANRIYKTNWLNSGR